MLRIAPSSYHYHHAGIGVDKYAGLRARVVGMDTDGGALCRAPAFDVSVHAQKESPYATASQNELARQLYQLGVKAALGTVVSEKVIRRLMAEGGLSAHVPKRRRYSSYEGETTPAPGSLVNRDFTAERPNEKWLTDITEIKASDGKGVPLADDRLP